MVIITKIEGDSIALFFDDCRLGSINATHKYFCCSTNTSLSYSILKDISNLLRSAQVTTFQSRISFKDCIENKWVVYNILQGTSERFTLGVINLTKKIFFPKNYMIFYLCDIESIMDFMGSGFKSDWKKVGF